jgi:hypothetical protein
MQTCTSGSPGSFQAFKLRLGLHHWFLFSEASSLNWVATCFPDSPASRWPLCNYSLCKPIYKSPHKYTLLVLTLWRTLTNILSFLGSNLS